MLLERPSFVLVAFRFAYMCGLDQSPRPFRPAAGCPSKMHVHLRASDRRI
jgi:hypothetical protein